MLVFMSMSLGMFGAHLAGPPLAGALGLDIEFVAQVLGFLSMQGLALLWITMFLGEQDLTWTQAFGLGRKPGRSVKVAGVTMLLVIPFTLFVLGGAIALLYKLFGLTPEAQVTVSFIQRDPPTWQLVVMAFTATVLAPVAEEALFRGVLYTTLKQQGFHRAAFWGTSLLFAAIHMNIQAFIPLLFLALVWTWLYERTGNLLAPIAAHVIFNAVNFTALVMDLPEWLEKTVNG